MRFSTRSRRFLRLFAISAVVGAMVAVPAASAKSGARVRSLILPLSASSLASARSLPLQSATAQYHLTVKEISPAGTVIGPPVGGTVSSSPTGIDCPATCSYAFPTGPPGVTLVASADSGSRFLRWSGGCYHVYRSECDVALDGDKTITAYFMSAEPALTVKPSGPGSGTVASSPAGIDCPAAACTEWAPLGTQFTLTATADPGSTFTGWGGQGVCPGRSTCVITLTIPDAYPRVEAFFTVNSPPLKPCVVPNLKGKTLAAAKKTIRRHHCSVGEITWVTSSPKNKGYVISQSPKAGKHLPNGSKVALKLGRAKGGR
jgi:hypothetical protein